MQLDEDEARQLGVNVERVKLLCSALASLATAAAVAVSGLIGFVGLDRAARGADDLGPGLPARAAALGVLRRVVPDPRGHHRAQHRRRATKCRSASSRRSSARRSSCTCCGATSERPRRSLMLDVRALSAGYGARRGAPTASTSTSTAASWSPSSGRTAAARRRSCARSAACWRPTAARSTSTARDLREMRRQALARRDRRRPAGRRPAGALHARSSSC